MGLARAAVEAPERFLTLRSVSGDHTLTPNALTRRAAIASLASLAAAPSLAAPAVRKRTRETERPNVLLISVDDLNDWVGWLGGYPTAKTPNIDRLAGFGAAMRRAYTVVPVCLATRAATLFGKASWSTGCYTNDNVDWPEIPAFDGRSSLVRSFRDQGYKTIGTGKTFHDGWNGRTGLLASNDPDAWTEFDPLESYIRPQGTGGKYSYQAIGEVNQTTDDLRMKWLATNVLSKRHDGPIFVAAGVSKPHLRWSVPQAFFDMHPLDRLVYPLGALDVEHHRFIQNEDVLDLPKGGRAMARQTYPTHAAFKADKGLWLNAVQGYLAACSAADHSVGILLQGLLDGPNAANTIVALWSDHGWQLGEKLAWQKHTLWERALHIPVVFAGPGIAPGRRDDLFSGLDLYPTLCGLTGVEAPADLDGIDQSETVRRGTPGRRDLALSAWALDIEEGFSVADGPDWREDVHFSARTADHRLIKYGNGDLELYDHRTDPWEWNNIADAPENRGLIEAISARIPRPQDLARPAAPDGGKGSGDDD